MAFEKDFPDYKPNFAREAVPFPGIPPELRAAFGLEPEDWSQRDSAGSEAVGGGGVDTSTGTPPELRQVASSSSDASGSTSSSGDCTFTSTSSSRDAASGVSPPVIAAAVTQPGNAAGVTVPAVTGYDWPLPVIVLRGSSLPETSTREDVETAHERFSVV